MAVRVEGQWKDEIGGETPGHRLKGKVRFNEQKQALIPERTSQERKR